MRQRRLTDYGINAAVKCPLGAILEATGSGIGECTVRALCCMNAMSLKSKPNALHG